MEKNWGLFTSEGLCPSPKTPRVVSVVFWHCLICILHFLSDHSKTIKSNYLCTSILNLDMFGPMTKTIHFSNWFQWESSVFAMAPSFSSKAHKPVESFQEWPIDYSVYTEKSQTNISVSLPPPEQHLCLLLNFSDKLRGDVILWWLHGKPRSSVENMNWLCWSRIIWLISFIVHNVTVGSLFSTNNSVKWASTAF